MRRRVSVVRCAFGALQVEAGLRAQKSEEATRAAEMAAAALRQQLAAQSGSTAARDRDAKRMARLLALAEAKVAQQVGRCLPAECGDWVGVHSRYPPVMRLYSGLGDWS